MYCTIRRQNFRIYKNLDNIINISINDKDGNIDLSVTESSPELSAQLTQFATKILQENSVHFDELGLVNEDSLIIDDKTKVSIDDLIKSHTNWLTNYMEN